MLRGGGASGVTPSAGGFITPVVKRDTSAMTTLASVSETDTITSGTYSISTAEELAKLATMVNNGKVGENAEFVLANNIDLSSYSSGKGWTAIGKGIHSFSSKFDGNGYTVSNLYINRQTTSYDVGLFGFTDEAEIKNVGIVNCNVTGNENVGGLVGCIWYGTIENCYVTGNVTGNSRVGGLVGYNRHGTIENCYATGDVSSSGGGSVGGLAGTSSGTIENSYATGSVTASGDNTYAGGLAGTSDGIIENSYATGDVTASGDRAKAGGLAGSACGGTLENSYATGISTAEQGNAGGFIGYIYIDEDEDEMPPTITDCTYNEANANGIGQIYGGDVTNFDGLSAVPAGGDSSGYDGPFNIHVGANADADTNSILLDTAVGFDLNIDLTSIDGCLQAISDIDEVMTLVNDKIAELGSVYSRIESVQSTLDTTIINLTSAHSTIMDADIAEESAAYIKSQILQQVTSTVLLQANSISNIALMLVE